MIPISDDNPTLRTPVVTIGLLATIGAVWVFVQGAGLDGLQLARSVCELGLVPGMVGASGAISGVMGAYLVLYPRVRVNMLFILFIFIRVLPVPAWLVLVWWFGVQLLSGLPQLNATTGGVAFWAHVGGFVTGLVLVKLFENRALVGVRTQQRHRYHPDHP